MPDKKEFDVLVIGGGIAGQEAALNLANQDFKVILVEKDLSIGGKMIHLSKVFPTLDCAACITTPKVSETARHPNITIFTNSEIRNIEKLGENNFAATLIQKPRYVTAEFDPTLMKNYGYGEYKNVVTSMQMERQLVPTRPFNTVLRPKDGKMPDNIAYVLCCGSRDESVGNPICSQVCCMYSIKQAQLLMGALPMADVTIYYIDIRAFGKGFQEFYQQSIDMGVEFIKGKIAKISEKENGNLLLRYEDIENEKLAETEHDLVVLSVGMLANTDFTQMFKDKGIEQDDYHFVKQTDILLNPAKTSIDGIFAAGTATGPMDIPDSILSAGNASAETTSYIRRNQNEK